MVRSHSQTDDLIQWNGALRALCFRVAFDIMMDEFELRRQFCVAGCTILQMPLGEWRFELLAFGIDLVTDDYNGTVYCMLACSFPFLFRNINIHKDGSWTWECLLKVILGTRLHKVAPTRSALYFENDQLRMRVQGP